MRIITFKPINLIGFYIYEMIEKEVKIYHDSYGSVFNKKMRITYSIFHEQIFESSKQKVFKNQFNETNYHDLSYFLLNYAAERTNTDIMEWKIGKGYFPITFDNKGSKHTLREDKDYKHEYPDNIILSIEKYLQSGELIKLNHIRKHFNIEGEYNLLCAELFNYDIHHPNFRNNFKPYSLPFLYKEHLHIILRRNYDRMMEKVKKDKTPTLRELIQMNTP